MLIQTESPYSQSLGEGLVLRTATDERDVERVAEFCGSIHGPLVAGLSRHLALYHPDQHGGDVVFVEDEANGQVVSSLCLIPWTLDYEGVELTAGEQGIVATAEAYRRRGLIRAQVEYFKRRLSERGCLLSHIQGIPYFYRQFGYEYALPLEGGLLLEKRSVPEPPAQFTFRLATQDDLPIIKQFYDEAAHELAIHTVRSEAIWRYLLTRAEGTEMACENWLVQAPDASVAGYMRLPMHHFGKELVVNEVSDLGFEAALAALHHVKTCAEVRNQPAIRLNLPATSSMMRLARSLGAHDLGTYAWQIHVPNMAALLWALGPVLQRRIAHSPFAALTREIPLCFYRETISLRFEAGRLAEVTNLGPTGTGPVNLPPLQFIPLLLGYRTLDDLRAVYPDVRVESAWRLLVDTLFPKVSSFLYTIY